MATVYLATDTRHRRHVAVKVLRPDLASAIGAARFLTEIEIAAKLNHPHILGLHDSGESDGFVWYVMPFVDGGSLRARLAAGRPVPLEDALRITGFVADALTYAHRMGVLHRDIKPENILLSQGHPIVSDFGIAKAISTAGGASITRTGFPLGTPGYMSPEQAAGHTDVDERSDVYALAVVTYEMLVGEIPGRWPTEDDVRQGRLSDLPARHRAAFDSLPRHIEAAVVRALAVRLDQRTPSPAGLVGELTRPDARRRYSGGEVREIVRRAAEAEAVQPTLDGALTLGGVQRLAGEVGIPPEHVRSAAQSLAAEPGAVEAPPISKFLGAATRVVVERVVEGVVPDADLPVLIDESRRWFGNAGTVGTMVQSVSWSANRTATSGRDVSVMITTRGGRTRITVQEGLDQEIAGIFVGFGLGAALGGGGVMAGIIGGALGLPILIPFAALVWLAGCYALTRRTMRSAHDKKLRELETLADRLADLSRGLAVPERLITP